MSTPYETPTRPCPYCSAPCEATWIDIGVGVEQCSPYICEACHAVEVGPFDDTETRPLTDDERRTGWYAPEGREE